MKNDEKAKYIFQQLVERGAALPHTAVLCIETALNDLDIAAQQSVHPTVLCGGHPGGSDVKNWICQTCGLPIPHSG